MATLLSQVQVLPFDGQAAEASAKIRVKLESKGTPVGPYNIKIAGTALAHNATLVTHNTKEFNRIDGLKLVDWF
ncbi:PIN domain-containing protein [Psychrobacter pygoscelis]|uniref:PIN domain-containing protein n=1 Tax=Psychrobacter pygoscelis TaxID=2488563 RepID=UPI001A955297|nr:PIN domain-containing protein [Psychrobacter pygoscelis]